MLCPMKAETMTFLCKVFQIETCILQLDQLCYYYAVGVNAH